MQLDVTLVPGPGAPGFEAVEITVSATSAHPCPGTVVAAALAARWPGVEFSAAGRAVADLTCGVPPLCAGAVLVAGRRPVGRAGRRPGPPPPTGAGAPLLLAVISGPASGFLFALRRGEYRVGRGRVDVSIADPALSRHHGTFVVGEHSVHLSVPPGGRPRTCHVGDTFRCGDSTLSLRLAGGVEPSPGTGAPAAKPGPVVVHRGHGGPRGRWGTVAMAGVPLAMGGVLAWLTGSWMFLAFGAMSLLAAVVPLAGGRRRRFRADVRAAARYDAERRIRAAPGAADLCLRAAATDLPARPTPPRPVAHVGAASVRLGLGTRPANVTVEPADPSFTAPPLDHVPVMLEVAPGGADILGPPGAAEPLRNFIMMQLDAWGLPFVLRAPARCVPWAARFLPTCTVAVADPDTAVHELCVTGGTANRGPIIRFNPGVRTPGAAVVVLNTDRTGTLDGLGFKPDGVPDTVLDRYARIVAPAARTTGGDFTPLAGATLPGQASAAAVGAAWSAARGRSLSPVRLGNGTDAPVMFDFRRDGPHLLVGGTTGSGKSEFLRTLVGALALAHSPADVQFVFLDFKGGAGLGPLRQFPHGTALVTDLDDHGMARTLASLRAEIRTRESLLGRADAADLDEYLAGGPAGAGRPSIAHLFIVIDEFRALVDQYPDAMAELMRCAAVGRSLGLHLVMATQRPQGAIGADIRANVTSSVCLRVQSAVDSQDVIGTSAAAAIGVSTPGRAFLARAGESPEEFQGATLTLPADGASCTVTVLGTPAGAVPAPLPVDHGERHDAPDSPAAPAGDVGAVAAFLWGVWDTWRGDRAGPPPAVPVPVIADALPAAVALPLAETVGPDLEGALVLGLLDDPQHQAVVPLLWRPADDSHLACIGPAGSGAPETLDMVVGQVTAAALRGSAGAPAGLPFAYVLDGDGSLARHAGAPGVASHLAPGSLRAAVRLLRRLPEVDPGPWPLLLVVSGWGRWMAAFRNSPWPWAEEALADLMRRGDRNVVMAVGGERELAGATCMAAIPNRLYFPRGASTESRVAWPRLPGFAPLRGRAAAVGPLCRDGDTPAVVQLGTWTDPPPGSGSAVPAGRARPPVVVRALRDRLSVAETMTTAAATAGGWPADRWPADGRSAGRLLLGLGGDGLDPVTTPIRPGSVLLVVGSPGSGRSAFLRSTAALNAEARLVPDWRGVDARVMASVDESAAVVLVDDLDRLDPAGVDGVRAWLDRGAMIVAAVTNPLPPGVRLLAALGAQAPDCGVVVRPRRPQDADLFGVRLDVGEPEPPGRCVLVDHGALEWFQAPAPP
ncbi:FHA domain-containing protein [Specibacter cremeus]|uniref:FHA domain-containing protein n=1 Tax=Specibacter cremeus TaxID=1629051 RepID=UPI000F79FB16|nr:FHA domain-containing protein [Specibacter cremeus]